MAANVPKIEPPKLCRFEIEEGVAVCQNEGCGRRVTHFAGDDPGQIYAQCGPVVKRPPGLGDRLAAGLAWFGVTPSRYVRWKAFLGFAPKCGCHNRRRWLNEFPARLWAAIAGLLGRCRKKRGVSATIEANEAHHDGLGLDQRHEH